MTTKEEVDGLVYGLLTTALWLALAPLNPISDNRSPPLLPGKSVWADGCRFLAYKQGNSLRRATKLTQTASAHNMTKGREKVAAVEGRALPNL